MKNHPATLYTESDRDHFYAPFNLRIDPMERLMLINIQGDPDSVYEGFEPQVFDDPINGTGMLVVAYRRSGTVDVYHQPSLRMAHKDFGIVGKGLEKLIECPMERAVFEVSEAGVHLDVAFEDEAGRQITLRIRETRGRRRRPFAILAPLGSATEKPPSIPLIFLYGFYFVRRPGTEVEIAVDGRQHQPDRLPVPIDLAPVYFLRYAASPLIATWNETHDGPLQPLQPDETGLARQGDAVYEVCDNGGHCEIAAMYAAETRHPLRVEFTPPLPDIAALRDGTRVDGRFVITSEGSAGRVSGVYHAARTADTVNIRVQPTDGWQPNERKWSVLLMYRLVSMFKRWPQTYVWNATVQLNSDQPTMRAAWSRTQVPQGVSDA